MNNFLVMLDRLAQKQAQKQTVQTASLCLFKLEPGVVRDRLPRPSCLDVDAENRTEAGRTVLPRERRFRVHP
jgi:hypothetical protein